MSYVKELKVFIVKNTERVLELAIIMEELLSELKYLEPSKNNEKDNMEVSTFKQFKRYPHKLFSTALSALSEKELYIGSTNYLYSLPNFSRILHNGKELFVKECNLDASIDHGEDEAWTYNLDNPVVYGMFKLSTLKMLLDKQEKFLYKTPFKDISGTYDPSVELSIFEALSLMIKTLEDNSKEDYSILFIETEEELYYD